MIKSEKLNDQELKKISGGLDDGCAYVVSVFREEIEEEIRGYYDSLREAFDVGCEKVQELMRISADREYVVRVYFYNRSSKGKEMVYEEKIVIDDYYKKIN